MTRALKELRERLAEVHDLYRALGVLGWDQRTMMPSDTIDPQPYLEYLRAKVASVGP